MLYRNVVDKQRTGISIARDALLRRSASWLSKQSENATDFARIHLRRDGKKMSKSVIVR